MKILEGKLVSKKIKDTYVVEVSRVKPHSLYKKLVKISKKYKVVNTGFEDLEIGASVRIQEIKPVSKQKHFKISEVISNDTKKVKETKTKKAKNENTGKEKSLNKKAKKSK